MQHVPGRGRRRSGAARSGLLVLLVVGAGHAVSLPGVHAADGGRSGWTWPLDPQPRVVAPFDAPAGLYAPGHRGVDLAARVGQPVLAAGTGVVAFAGAVAGRGVVSVDHPGGQRTTYEPVQATVTVGDPVAAGEIVGTLTAGPGHCLPSSCLHWGLRIGEVYRDPLGLLGVLPARLLPIWQGMAIAGRAGPTRDPPPQAARSALPEAAVAGSGSAAGSASGSRDRGPLLARG